MNYIRQYTGVLIGLALLVTIGLWLYVTMIARPAQVLSILTANEDVEIGANVNGCVLEIIILPERRVPATNNWSTELNVDIRSGGVSVVNFTAVSNSSGYSATNLCNLGIFPPAGNYDYYIRGFSHLQRVFPNLASFNFFGTYHNLSATGKQLLAGETSPVFDNRVNSLDISTQIKALYTADNKNDLNHDGVVNGLDVSNSIYNFWMTGE